MPEIRIPVTTTGSAGSASGTEDSEPITGFLMYARIEYHSAPSTTTVDIDEVLSGALGRKLLDKAASNTNVTHYPRHEMQNNTGTGVGLYQPEYLAGRPVRVTIALSDALDPAVTVILGIL